MSDSPIRYPHRDSAEIDKTRSEQEARMKTFKGGKPVTSEWLTKRKSVRSENDGMWQRFTPREKP